MKDSPSSEIITVPPATITLRPAVVTASAVRARRLRPASPSGTSQDQQRVVDPAPSSRPAWRTRSARMMSTRRRVRSGSRRCRGRRSPRAAATRPRRPSRTRSAGRQRRRAGPSARRLASWACWIRLPPTSTRSPSRRRRRRGRSAACRTRFRDPSHCARGGAGRARSRRRVSSAAPRRLRHRRARPRPAAGRSDPAPASAGGRLPDDVDGLAGAAREVLLEQVGRGFALAPRRAELAAVLPRELRDDDEVAARIAIHAMTTRQRRR